MTTIIDKLPGRVVYVSVYYWDEGQAVPGQEHFSANITTMPGIHKSESEAILVSKMELEAYITERERKAWEAAKEGTTTAVDENSTGEWISIEDWRKKERER